MDVTKILEADHRSVEGVFAKIERTDGEERQPFIDELITSLRSHMQLEEDIVYPPMEPVTGHEAVQEATTEHELARKGLADLERLAPDEPGFGAALAAVKAGISHHVKEEEDDVFPKLRREGAKALDKMATPFMQRRVELGLSTEADALSDASTKDELLAEATAAGVDKAPSMSKGELAEALADRMAVG